MGKRSRQRRRGKDKSLKSQKANSAPTMVEPRETSYSILDNQIEELFNAKEYQKAIDILLAADQRTPLPDSLLTDLAYAQLVTYAENHQDSALETTLRIKSHTPASRRIQVWCYLGKADYDNAVKTAEELLHVSDTPQNRYVLCVALLKDRSVSDLFHYRDDSTDQAVVAERKSTLSRMKEVLEGAVNQEGCFPECFYWLDDIYLYDSRSAPEYAQKELELLELGFKVYAEDEEMRYRLAQCLNRASRRKEAVELLKWGLTADKPSGTILLRGAELASWANDYETALLFLERAETLGLVKGLGKDLFKADFYRELGQVEITLGIYEQVSKSDDDKVCAFHGLVNLSLMYSQQGKKQEAVGLALKAAQIWWDELRQKDSSYHYIDSPFVDYDRARYDRYGMHLHQESEESLIDLANTIADDLDVRNDDQTARLAYILYQAYRFQGDSDDAYQKIAALFVRTAHLLNDQVAASNLADAYKSMGDYAAAFDAHIQRCIYNFKNGQEVNTYFGSDDYDENGQAFPLEKVVDKKAATALHKNFLRHYKIAEPELKGKILKPIFLNALRWLLKAHGMHKQIAEASAKLLKDFPDDVELLWANAYYEHEVGCIVPAEKSYRHLLELEPDNWSALHNLALIRDKMGFLDEAIELSDKALTLAPNDELVIRINKGFRAKAETATDAKQKWDELDYFKRKIIYHLRRSSIRRLETLSRNTGIEEKVLRGHCRNLVKSGWLIDADKLTLSALALALPTELLTQALDNTYRGGSERGARPIRSDYQDDTGTQHGIRTTYVTRRGQDAIRPIFNSKTEYMFYCEFVLLFPNHLVIPNMALQSLFNYDVMKGLLSPDDFSYYLKAQVDICILSTNDFKPRYAFEIDSVFHDEEKQAARDERKDRIFRIGNITFIRMRPFKFNSSQEIREEIIKAMRLMPDDVRAIATNLSLELELQDSRSEDAN